MAVAVTTVITIMTARQGSRHGQLLPGGRLRWDHINNVCCRNRMVRGAVAPQAAAAARPPSPPPLIPHLALAPPQQQQVPAGAAARVQLELDGVRPRRPPAAVRHERHLPPAHARTHARRPHHRRLSLSARWAAAATRRRWVPSTATAGRRHRTTTCPPCQSRWRTCSAPPTPPSRPRHPPAAPAWPAAAAASGVCPRTPPPCPPRPPSRHDPGRAARHRHPAPPPPSVVTLPRSRSMEARVPSEPPLGGGSTAVTRSTDTRSTDRRSTDTRSTDRETAPRDQGRRGGGGVRAPGSAARPWPGSCGRRRRRPPRRRRPRPAPCWCATSRS
jgi:hypothetical protein